MSGGSSSLSSGVQDKYREYLGGEIRHVQNLIERCVQKLLYDTGTFVVREVER